MKLVLIFSLLFSQAVNAANNILVLNGKAYDLKEQEQYDCASEPEFAAMKFQLNASYTAGVLVGELQCIKQCVQNSGQNCESFCKSDPEQIVKNLKVGLKTMFATVRKYPPYNKSNFCAAGRQYCEDKCLSVENDSKLCSIECNQYESFYKK